MSPLWAEGDALSPANLNTKLPTQPLLSSQSLVGVSSTNSIVFGLPGNSLGTDGQTLRVYAKGLGRGTAGLRLSFGATNLISAASLANNNKFDIDAEVHRVGATSQTGHARFFNSSLSFNLIRSAPAETLSSVVTIALAATSAVTFDIHHFEVSLVPSI